MYYSPGPKQRVGEYQKSGVIGGAGANNTFSTDEDF